MSLVYRPACEQDLERADAIVVASINDLTERHGFGPMAVSRPPKFQLFSLQDDPGGLWVAEDDGEIVGFAWSWVCGELWFLAQLFVVPGQQGRGIGQELLRLSLDHAKATGAAHKALITFTFNKVSQGLYIRHGIFPRFPVYGFSVERERLLPHLQTAPLRCVAIENSGAHRRCLDEIDACALGVSRAKHHRYLAGDAATEGVLLYDGNDCAGYVYVSSDGQIGPLAVAREANMGSAFTTALGLTAEGGAAQVSAMIPGTCDSALSLAVRHGMRITFPMLLMADRDFGAWTKYLPRNPGFM
jgi:ribosomal protein S18 acetylase RimI-like enzyme